MEKETERIIQVSLSKISDSRRRRGGPLLRRSLLVSNILNSAITTSEISYRNYRTPKEFDLDCDVLEQEAICVDRPNSLRDDAGGSGNSHEFRNTSNNNAQDGKVLCERTVIENQVVNTSTTKEKDHKTSVTNSSPNSLSSNKESTVKSVTVGLKRPRSQYVNEPCEKHAVTRKRCRTMEKNSKDSENIEPMDVSVLVNVFSTSLSGLSGFSTNSTSSETFIFSCINSPVNSGYSLPKWQHTVAAF